MLRGLGTRRGQKKSQIAAGFAVFSIKMRGNCELWWRWVWGIGWRRIDGDGSGSDGCDVSVRDLQESRECRIERRARDGSSYGGGVSGVDIGGVENTFFCSLHEGKDGFEGSVLS